MLTEKMIHVELERLIRSGEFYSSIDEKDIQRIKNLVHVDENLLPAFSIDEYIRRKYASATDNALRSTEQLQVLTSDDNVSTQLRQILRPDLVCINPERQQIVIFEIKKSTQTERQALTELLAYEHEIINILPFLSTYDLTFVLVSTEWSVLLEHAAGSAISWSNKNLLCLKVDLNQNNFKLNIHGLNSWSITGNAFFPPKSVASFTVSFEAAQSMEESEITYRLDLLLGFFAREADRVGLHGFALVVQDLGPYCDRGYQIVFCAVSPLALFDSMLSSGQITTSDGHLVEEIEKHKLDHGTESGISSLDDLIKKIVIPRLGAFTNVEFGGYFSWDITRNGLKDRCLPTFVEFWGLPGDYARAYINNPAVQNARTILFESGMTDWRNPTTGLWLIRNLFKPTFCGDGFVRPSDTFRLGLAIGHDDYLRQVARHSPSRPKSIEAAMFWNYSTFDCYIDELFILARTATTISPPKEAIRISGDVDQDISHDALIKWVVSEILQSDNFHVKAFYLGLNLAQAVTAEDLRPSNFIQLSKDEQTLNNFRLTTEFILKFSAETPSYNEAVKNKKISSALNILGITTEGVNNKAIDLSGVDLPKLCEAVKDIFSIADLTIPAITHLFEELPAMHVDWDTLKEGIDGMYNREVRYPAIYISTNGSIGTASYDNVEYAKLFRPLSDTELEVYVMDGSSGFETFRIEKWEDVRKGKLVKLPGQ
ncbi:hypothetical protein [Pseudomonas syringae]|uniref:Uncharacterized protein n=1 Tax=Pseudomonas syringae UB303 TaxID=1357287 RepID=A0AAJ4B0E7_PSESX|nr:hypothetical protein [Pseudomonas syringae]QHF06079.1 hypothetical protein N026_00625 [Pseudomonas syringae UB303]